MNLLHIKLHNGEDLLTYGVLSEDKKTIHISDPISVEIEPDIGIFARSWLMYSEKESVVIPTNITLFIHKANSKAVDYYNEFMDQLQQQKGNKQGKTEVDSFEDLFNTMLEAKNSIKH